MSISISEAATVWSEPADRRDSAEPLLLLMHGYGADEADLVGLAPHLPRGLATVSVRAPLAAGPGFAWVPIDEPGRPDPQATQDAADAVLAWLGSHVPESRPVGLLGFSQGGLMVTHLLRSAPRRFWAGAVLSGFVVDAPHPGDDEVAEVRPPVFFGYGDRDQIITPDAFARAHDWLSARTDLTEVVYPGLPHGISPKELQDVSTFLTEHTPR
jgi:phospholipase/carboxylesterase